MREVLNVDAKALEIDPMRLAQPPTEREKQYPARVRLGPDWFAFAGNWMTEWERTGDVKWRDKIYAGMDSVTALPFGIRSGLNLVYGYDPATGKLYKVSDRIGDYNLATIQGGAEVVFELNQLVDNPKWQEAWLQYCRLENAPAVVVQKDMQTHAEAADGSEAGPGRLAAYAYGKTGNAAFATVAIRELARMDVSGSPPQRDGAPAGAAPRNGPKHVEGPDVLNPIDEVPLSTNSVAQTSLSAIEILQLCADKLPAELPRNVPPEGRAGRKREGGPAKDVRTPGE
jgi:hypothetical protein